jgi:hypothetical protein
MWKFFRLEVTFDPFSQINGDLDSGVNIFRANRGDTKTKLQFGTSHREDCSVSPTERKCPDCIRETEIKMTKVNLPTT